MARALPSARVTRASAVWQEAEVRDWLKQLIDELESELEPPAPSYSPYELKRQRTIVSNARMLLQLAQGALRGAGVGASIARIAFLESECSKAKAHVLECECELENVERHVNV